MTRSILLAAIVACGTTPSHSVAPTAAPTPPAAWLACTADADCEIVELGCCDHCNGGRVVAVEHALVERTVAMYHERCEPGSTTKLADGTIAFSGTSCTELGCSPVRAACEAGACSAVVVTSDR